MNIHGGNMNVIEHHTLEEVQQYFRETKDGTRARCLGHFTTHARKNN